jgi:hypothetical protein
MTHSTLETYYDKNYNLTTLSVISFISSYALYYSLHKKDCTNLLNIIYSLMQEISPIANNVILRYKNMNYHMQLIHNPLVPNHQECLLTHVARNHLL